MAHITLHFAFGMLAATLALAPGLLRAWRSGAALSGPLGRWLLVSYGAGLFAVAPSLLRRAGLPDAACEGWWMNVFLLYPAVKSVFRRGGMPLGAAVLALVAAAQYAALLAAIVSRRAARRAARSR